MLLLINDNDPEKKEKQFSNVQIFFKGLIKYIDKYSISGRDLIVMLELYFECPTSTIFADRRQLGLPVFKGNNF